MNNSSLVSHSLLSSNYLDNFVSRNYEVGQVKLCRLLVRGMNDTYSVETDRGKYILRVYRSNWRSQSDIYFELDVLTFLFEKGMAVSAPIKSIEGQLAVEINAPEAVRYITLFTFAPGDRPKLNQEISYMYGKTLANIHNFTDHFQPAHHRFSLDFDHLLNKPLGMIRPLVDEYNVDVPYIESWVYFIKNHVPSGLDWVNSGTKS
jgi:Ser/Thr protein kinase RdoA (MazF antagonist)